MKKIELRLEESDLARLDRQAAEEPTRKEPIARLVQPAVPQQEKWNRRKRPGHLADFINFTAWS